MMPRWNQGSTVVDRLLEQRQLDRVPADLNTAEALLESSRRHVATASGSTATDPEGALSLAYDAARKAATALLSHQGLRPTSAGGHIVIIEVLDAQFPGVPGLKSLDRLRRRRNQSGYPDPAGYDPVTEEEADEAITVADACIDSVIQLLATPELGVY